MDAALTQRPLGHTGLSVSVMGMGTCFMGVLGEEGVAACVRHGIDRGVNYFDTAADYGKGGDERLLGQALQGVRDRIILATKVGYTPDPREHRSAAGLMRQFDGSLARLRTDHVDIIQVNEADFLKWWTDRPLTPEEGLNHLGALIRDDEEYDFAGAPVVEFLYQAKATGKARFVGLTAKDARRTARILAGVNVDTVMTAHQFNPILRNAQTHLFPLTEKRGIGVVGGAVLMKGWLASEQTAWRGTRPAWMDDAFFNAYFAFVRISRESGIPMAELTVRWVLEETRQASLVFGFSGQSVIDENLDAAAKGPLPADVKARVDAIGLVHPLLYQGRTTL
jgi:L-galactose dehydrogenase